MTVMNCNKIARRISDAVCRDSFLSTKSTDTCSESNSLLYIDQITSAMLDNKRIKIHPKKSS